MNNMTNEIWKDIPGYEGLYMASNLGNVKSLDRVVRNSDTSTRVVKGMMRKGSLANSGYLNVGMGNNGVTKTFHIHQLVAMAFLNHTPCKFELVVNHINFNKLDNRLENLELVTARVNANMKHLPSTSEYVGVSARGSKWASILRHKTKDYYMGTFDTEIEASEYYENAVKAIENGTEIKVKRFEYTSKYKGVYFDKGANKWRVYLNVNNKKFGLGYFPSEDDAYKARVNYCIANNLKYA